MRATAVQAQTALTLVDGGSREAGLASWQSLKALETGQLNARNTVMPEEAPKYQINIEGTLFAWDDGTITVSQIRALGGLPTNVAVLMIDLKTNQQRELAEDEVVELRPGLGFAKKVKFQRG
jgi:hypothetical protein